jgi:hypothetical protein
VPHAAQELDLVALEGHPGAAAVPQPAAGQLVGDVVGGEPDTGRHRLDDPGQGGAVGLACGQPAQHA